MRTRATKYDAPAPRTALKAQITPPHAQPPSSNGRSVHSPTQKLSGWVFIQLSRIPDSSARYRPVEISADGQSRVELLAYWRGPSLGSRLGHSPAPGHEAGRRPHISAKDRYQSGTKIGGAEDDFFARVRNESPLPRNRRCQRPLHNPTLHGGGGATVAYTRNNLAAGKFQVKISGPPSEARGTRKNAW